MSAYVRLCVCGGGGGRGGGVRGDTTVVLQRPKYKSKADKLGQSVTNYQFPGKFSQNIQSVKYKIMYNATSRFNLFHCCGKYLWGARCDLNSKYIPLSILWLNGLIYG